MQTPPRELHRLGSLILKPLHHACTRVRLRQRVPKPQKSKMSFWELGREASFASGGADHMNEVDGFSRKAGVPNRKQARMILTEKRSCWFPRFAAAKAKPSRSGNPQMAVGERSRHQPDPGGP